MQKAVIKEETKGGKIKKASPLIDSGFIHPNLKVCSKVFESAQAAVLHVN